MTKAQQADRDEAINELRARLKPGQEVLCILRHVSRSGMQRVIDLKVIENGELRGIGWTAARALGYRHDDKRDGVIVDGCGMDMGFSLVYNLSSAIWRDGFDCLGRENHCPSNDHSNREHNEHHRSGGYALRTRWI